jgi:hypothetical protein
MKEYTIQLTDAEDLALSHVAAVQQEWINNAVKNRCRTAMDEIVKICVDQCLAENIAIPGTRDDIVTLAFTKSWVKTAQQMHEETTDAMVSNQ